MAAGADLTLTLLLMDRSARLQPAVKDVTPALQPFPGIRGAPHPTGPSHSVEDETSRRPPSFSTAHPRPQRLAVKAFTCTNSHDSSDNDRRGKRVSLLPVG